MPSLLDENLTPPSSVSPKGKEGESEDGRGDVGDESLASQLVLRGGWDGEIQEDEDGEMDLWGDPNDSWEAEFGEGEVQAVEKVEKGKEVDREGKFQETEQKLHQLQSEFLETIEEKEKRAEEQLGAIEEKFHDLQLRFFEKAEQTEKRADEQLEGIEERFHDLQLRLLEAQDGGDNGGAKIGGDGDGDVEMADANEEEEESTYGDCGDGEELTVRGMLFKDVVFPNYEGKIIMRQYEHQPRHVIFVLNSNIKFDNTKSPDHPDQPKYIRMPETVALRHSSLVRGLRYLQENSIPQLPDMNKLILNNHKMRHHDRKLHDFHRKDFVILMDGVRKVKMLCPGQSVWVDLKDYMCDAVLMAALDRWGEWISEFEEPTGITGLRELYGESYNGRNRVHLRLVAWLVGGMPKFLREIDEYIPPEW